jgi:adenine phosphoribosyltransferase
VHEQPSDADFDTAAGLAAAIRAALRDVPDFPIAGIAFKDIGGVLAGPALLAAVTGAFARNAVAVGAQLIAGVEARGFLLAGGTAHQSGCGMLAVRKAGKLPPPTVAADYELEYGIARIEIPADVVRGQRIYVVDDVLATGGTLAATIDLIESAGGIIAGVGVLLELAFLGGRARLGERAIDSLLID